MQFLQVRNIPVYSKRSLNILEIQLGKKLIMLLKWLESEHEIPFSGDEMLFEILHFDWFGIPPIEIAKLSVEAANTKYSGNPSAMRKLLSEKATCASDRPVHSRHANEQLIEGRQDIGRVDRGSSQPHFAKSVREDHPRSRCIESDHAKR